MTSRNPSLDVLRGIAVLLVIIGHYPYFGWMTAGWFGVDLFFVLSGFLISGLLFSELQQTGSIRIGRFLMRRGFKIYPAFFFFVAVTSLAWPEMRSHLWGACLFVQNFLPEIRSAPLHGWGHLWSLAIEEHFYLMLPFILIALYRVKRVSAVPQIALALIGACFLYRLFCVTASDQFTAIMYRTQSRVDALFIGVALSYLYRFEKERFERISASRLLWMWPLLGIPSILWLGTRTVLSLSTMIMLNAIAFGMLLCLAVSRNIRFTPLQFVGRHSYSIYLWHSVVLVYFLRKPMTVLHFSENIICALALGVVMARIVEFPVLKIRDRVRPASPVRESYIAPAPSPSC